MANAKQQEAQEVSGIPVDGELYMVRDLSASEQRELRKILREFTGQEQASLEYLVDFGYADECDLVPAVTYLVRKRTDPNYTLEQTDDLDLKEVEQEAVRLTKEKGRRPRRPRAAAPTSET
jgi:hypothetical protein